MSESTVVYAEIEWVKDDVLGYYINDFQDYEYASGGFVPEGERVGRMVDGDLILDPGIHFAGDARYTHNPEEEGE